MSKTPEKKFQTDLVAAARQIPHGYAIKMSNQFLIGIPDLLIKLPMQPALFLECKTEPWPKKAASIPVALTPMQRKHLRDLQDSGALAGWCVMCVVDDVQRAYVGIDVDMQRLDTESFMRYSVSRDKGKPWDVREMVRTVDAQLAER